MKFEAHPSGENREQADAVWFIGQALEELVLLAYSIVTAILFKQNRPEFEVSRELKDGIWNGNWIAKFADLVKFVKQLTQHDDTDIKYLVTSDNVERCRYCLGPHLTWYCDGKTTTSKSEKSEDRYLVTQSDLDEAYRRHIIKHFHDGECSNRISTHRTGVLKQKIYTYI